MPSHTEIGEFIWRIADHLRGDYEKADNEDVILPFTLLRRLDCVWEKAREKIREEEAQYAGKLNEENLKKRLAKASEVKFYNRSRFSLVELTKDATNIKENFGYYLEGFSDNIKEILYNFSGGREKGLSPIYETLARKNLLYLVTKEFASDSLDLHPDAVSNHDMGLIYEYLIRKFKEGSAAGEQYTPRDVVRLLVQLVFADVEDSLKTVSGKLVGIYDPACGTGGMLSVAKEHLLDRAQTEAEKANVEQYLAIYGQELQPANYAICQADLLIKDDKQAEVHLGNSLIPHDPTSKEPGDQLSQVKHRFDFMLSNPPFGVTWGGKDGYESEARKLQKTRYRAGMPRSNDGALLFLQTMLAKMKPADKGGSRMAIIFNGSPLSNGDCGSGESEIRRWILESDWLDAIVMLPDQLFYNTGIFTYIWLLRNEKPASHRNRVMLIDARKQYEKEPKSFGNKRNRIADSHRAWIETRYRAGWEDDFHDDDVKLFRISDFAYHKVEVVFWQTDKNDQPAIVTEPYTKVFSPANMAKEQAFYASDLVFNVRCSLPSPCGRGDRGDGESTKTTTVQFTLKPEDSFAKVWDKAVREALADELAALTQGSTDARANKQAEKAFIDTLQVQAVEWTHRHYVQDDEYIPFGEDIDAFLEREIAKPIIRWKDSPQLGYEILPNKYFYRYQPPTPAKVLLEQFWALEQEAEKMLEGLVQE